MRSTEVYKTLNDVRVWPFYDQVIFLALMGKNKSLLKDNLVTWEPKRCNINDATYQKTALRDGVKQITVCFVVAVVGSQSEISLRKYLVLKIIRGHYNI